jgi:preprotein translocase subunit SecY
VATSPRRSEGARVKRQISIVCLVAGVIIAVLATIAIWVARAGGEQGITTAGALLLSAVTVTVAAAGVVGLIYWWYEP